MGLKYKIGLPLDTAERALLHHQIILGKPFLKNLYLEWYKIFIDECRKLPPGKIVEIGSGGGFIKESMPDVLTSDILMLPINDLSFSALNMPFDDFSISGLLALNTFHHLSDADLFLSETNRVLKANGKLLMIEPANSIWGRFIYSHFHHEPFYQLGHWQIPLQGPLSGANGALPWIVFIRDENIFIKKYPKLIIEEISYHTPLSYLLSGGVSFKNFVPNTSFSLFKIIDSFLVTISKQLSMFMTIKIKKLK